MHVETWINTLSVKEHTQIVFVFFYQSNTSVIFDVFQTDMQNASIPILTLSNALSYFDIYSHFSWDSEGKHFPSLGHMSEVPELVVTDMAAGDRL